MSVNNMGFDVESCVNYVSNLVSHDEVERALLVLDNVPAYYRDSCPEELLKLRRRILNSRMTAVSYQTNDNDTPKPMDFCTANFTTTMRGNLLKAEIKNYNAQGLTPHLIDMGPGDFWLPMALSQTDLKVTYHPIGLHKDARNEATKHFDHFRKDKSDLDQPEIFIATEIIEHLPDTNDIGSECAKYCRDFPERIFISTPCYTFYVNNDWDKIDGMGHLRAYTPSEFMSEIRRIFPGYSFQCYQEKIITARGMRGDKLSEPLIKFD